LKKFYPKKNGIDTIVVLIVFCLFVVLKF